MRILCLLGFCCTMFLLSFLPLSAQSDYVVFERAYHHYVQENHISSILLLETQLKEYSKKEQELQQEVSPLPSYVQLSPKAYNQGLLLLLQLSQSENFHVPPSLFPTSLSDFAYCIGSQSKPLLWQKAQQALSKTSNNSALQEQVAKGFTLAAMAALKLNDYTNAATYFEKALLVDAHYKFAKLGIARLKFQQGKSDDALQLLQQLSEQFPNERFVNLCKAEIYLSLEYYDRATKSLDIFLGHLPSENGILTFNQHELLMKNGQNKMFLRNYDVAETYFSKAIELNDDAVAAFVARAEARAYRLKLKEAEEDLSIARSLDSENPRVFHMLGYVKMLEWQNEEALAYFSKAIDLQGDIKEAYIHRSSVKSVLGDIEGAIEDLNQVIRMDEKADKSYAVRAYLKSRKGDLKGALTDYNQAVALSPENASHFIGRAAVKEQLEMEESYLDDLDKAINLNPKNYFPYHAKGAWYQKQKRKWQST